MFTLLLLFIVLIIFISHNQLVVDGGSYGLMLWYQNVLPLLLPFMLISSMIENKIASLDSKNKGAALIASFFIGTLCGYPVGAKTISTFVSENVYDIKLGNIILPLCNNISPMFLSGYIIHITLHDSVSFVTAIILIFTPYIFYIGIRMFFYRENVESIETARNTLTLESTGNDYIEKTICQITYVGFYIMFCSIIIEFINSLDFIPEIARIILSGITEITRGSNYVSSALVIGENVKTALILALSSWGGISSILQTGKVIQKSGLSLIHYITIKLICSIATFCMAILFI